MFKMTEIKLYEMNFSSRLSRLIHKAVTQQHSQRRCAASRASSQVEIMVLLREQWQSSLLSVWAEDQKPSEQTVLFM